MVSIKKIRKKIDTFDEIPGVIKQVLYDDDERQPEGNLSLDGFDLPGVTVGDTVTLKVTGKVERMSKSGDNPLSIGIKVNSIEKVK